MSVWEVGLIFECCFLSVLCHKHWMETLQWLGVLLYIVTCVIILLIIKGSIFEGDFYQLKTHFWW